MGFVDALRKAHGVAVIAEVKRKSPSRGALNPLISAPARAAEYVAGGAVALSVLTEPSEFGGSISDLIDVHRQVQVPLLRKDFHVHESQIWEARVAGASALLLIARALEPSRLEVLVGEAMEAGLEPLIEVRSAAELDLALRLGASMIGINARDLETLAIEPEVVEQLLPRVPADRLAIAESGLGGVADVERLAARGADAVLVGSHLSLSDDGVAAVRALVSVPRQGRAA
jgi:indole-3-glycerol phosphate synthase